MSRQRRPIDEDNAWCVIVCVLLWISIVMSLYILVSDNHRDHHFSQLKEFDKHHAAIPYDERVPSPMHDVVDLTSTMANAWTMDKCPTFDYTIDHYEQTWSTIKLCRNGTIIVGDGMLKLSPLPHDVNVTVTSLTCGRCWSDEQCCTAMGVRWHDVASEWIDMQVEYGEWYVAIRYYTVSMWTNDTWAILFTTPSTTITWLGAAPSFTSVTFAHEDDDEDFYYT